MKRIGILTGGGDCPGLNAVLRAVGRTAMGLGWETIGFEDGYLGVLEKRWRVLTSADLAGILSRGGTILGTSNRDNPFRWKPHSSDYSGDWIDRSPDVAAVCSKLGLDGLIVVGGDGSLSIASKLMSDVGVPCIGVPKTIDNDVYGTDFTFGFDTAVQTVTEAIDRLHSTAMSHHRSMVVEVMGRYAGWLALHAGVAGGGDIILIPEIPYRLDSIFRRISQRSKIGKQFSIVVVAEGSRDPEGKLVATEHDAARTDPVRLGGIGTFLAREIERATGIEARATVLGHLQRGGSPTARDRLLATEFGHLAAVLAAKGEWGRMVAFNDGQFTHVPLESVAERLKLVAPDHQLISAARAVGTSFGD